LVVDDDSTIRDLICLYLEEEFTVIQASTGIEAIEKVKAENPSLVLLDIMLPQKNGWEVCKEIRTFSKIPIIMVSAKGTDVDKIVGLEIGADDYIVKPFNPRELLARVKAQLRRTAFSLEQSNTAASGANNENDQLVFKDLVIDPKSYKVLIKGEPVELTAKEFELLSFMANNAGQVFNRDQLLDKIWGFDYAGESRAVDSSIKRLRKKLNLDEQNYIHTIRGVGYKFEVPLN
jgi:DNA-binding response OmpR family regulator